MMARLLRSVTTNPAPLRVIAVPIEPPSGYAIDAIRYDKHTAIVVYDPDVYDKTLALTTLARSAGRPLFDLDTRKVVTP